MATQRVLVVDDEEGMLEVCAATLRRLDGVEVQTEGDSLRAAERLRVESYDLLITDIRMPGLTGVQLLQQAREQDAGIAALMLTAFPSVDTAVESMKLGAADYITKPFIPEDLLATAQRLLIERRLQEENQLLSRHVERAFSFDEIIGDSPPMHTVFKTIQRIAETDADVLILGDTGTGKELVARSIYQHSRRAEGRFVPVDCGAIPDGLLESELFGHERGAFTGAHKRSLGLMELADHGTLFLDEIGELPIRLQSKLLRTLQERCIRRVGGSREIDVDVRIIAATSRDIDKEVKEGHFRKDLYYRINVALINLPSLYNRGDDIALLASHFMTRYAQEMDKPEPTIDREVIEILLHYNWPGNVRELQNVVKRTLLMARSQRIQVEDLPDEIVTVAGHHELDGDGGFFESRDKHMEVFEKNYLMKLLQTSGGDVSQASREALLPRGTLYRLLKKHGLKPESFRT